MALNVGVIGCGNISDTYLTNGPLFRDFTYVACADLRLEAAQQKAQKYGLVAFGIDELINRDDIDAVLNLTVPAAHCEVSIKAIEAGKHVFTEKPLSVSLREGADILRAAARKGVRVGSAPDTVLSPTMLAARAIVDSGRIGQTVTGLATVLSHGMEDWHPNPEFFFKKGGGPVLDMGPYYVAALVNMLGPVKRVQATGRIGNAERIVTAEGPMKGKPIKVETFTTLNALLSFASGAEVTFLASWDVFNTDLRPIELHGTDGTLRVPDPNNFGGVIEVASRGGQFESVSTFDLPYGTDNRLWLGELPYSCYRGLGLAEMARSIAAGVEHRCSGAFAYHALEVMLAIETGAAEGRPIDIDSRYERFPLSSVEETATYQTAAPEETQT